MTKIFWSELDVRIHEAALGILGPERRGRRQPVDEGLPVRAVGPDLRRAPTRSSATSSPSASSACPALTGAGDRRDMRFAFTDDQLALRDAVRDLLANECPPAVVRAAWDNADGRSGAAWAALAEMGVLGAGRARGPRRPRLLDARPRARHRGDRATPRCPSPSSSTRSVAVPALPRRAPAAGAAGEVLVTAALGGAAVRAVRRVGRPAAHRGGRRARRRAARRAADRAGDQRRRHAPARLGGVGAAPRPVGDAGRARRRLRPRRARRPPRSSSGSPAGCSTSPSTT